MMKTKQKASNLQIEIDTKVFQPEQVRLIRSILIVMTSLLQAKDEDAFFNNSAELMRLSASLINQSNFTKDSKVNNISYTEQALEYSLEILQECMNASSIVIHDN